jgi:hypothetical protein
MTRMPHRPSLGLAVAAATLATITAFAASPVFAADGVATLGSPPPEEEQGSAPAVDVDPMDAMLDFAACMREQGVDMPDPQGMGGSFMVTMEVTSEADIGDPGAFMDDTFMVAEEACREHLGAMAPAGDPGLDAEIMEGLLAHATCMREQGIDMPDPVMDGGVISIGPMDGPGDTGIDYFSDEYMAAEEACRGVMPFESLGAPLGGTQ